MRRQRMGEKGLCNASEGVGEAGMGVQGAWWGMR